jgi:hypothetical protein
MPRPAVEKPCFTCAHYFRREKDGPALCARTRQERAKYFLVSGWMDIRVRYCRCRYMRQGGTIGYVLNFLLSIGERRCSRQGRFWTPRTLTPAEQQIDIPAQRTGDAA